MSELDTASLHPTLRRQLRRSGIGETAEIPGVEQWHKLLLAISRAYEDTAQQEALNERALDLASAEMQDLYRGLEARVAERTHEIEQAQAELQATNEELQAQSEELEAQHEALQNSNVELEIKTADLEAQRSLLADQNLALDQAKHALEIKAEEASRASQYKSAFLASMSHELRTPLNSLLILADILGQNTEGNLTEEQVTFAETIHGAGSDLLELINQILDLAKIESGGVVLDISDVNVNGATDSLRSLFAPIAHRKNVGFGILVGGGVPGEVRTDATKMNQVLKNLLSNACKFTESGSIQLTINAATAADLEKRTLPVEDSTPYVAFSVVDTGVGIAEDKRDVIFEAFQQADTGTARKYGGTGLGLSISRELARALGGDISLVSTPGRGSTFTLYLPADYADVAGVVPELPDVPGQRDLDAPRQAPTVKPVRPARNGLPVLLIVEDDPRFANILVTRSRNAGFEPVLATNGAEAVALADEHLPDAMTLDLRLPDTDGWSVLDEIHRNPELANLPVHIISVEEEQERGRDAGAFGYLTKPVHRTDLDKALRAVASHLSRANRLLLVGADDGQRNAIAELLDNEEITIVSAENETAALAAMRDTQFGCVVADLEMPDIDGIGLLERLRDIDDQAAIIGLTEQDLTADERRSMHRNAATVITKGDRSNDRLLDEVSLFLHGVSRRLPAQRQPAQPSVKSDQVLTGKVVLIVDDDPRNVFAVSNVLERQGMVVKTADNGRTGLEALEANANIDVVLMDIMMPEMDGYEAMRRIRSDGAYRTLPILALTALAMGSDRSRCLEAGASDYISKPVDPAQLISLLRVWLHQ